MPKRRGKTLFGCADALWCTYYIGIFQVNFGLMVFFRCKYLPLLVVPVFLLTACASQEIQTPGASASNAVPSSTREPKPEKLPPELVFELMAAELAQKQGHTDQAAERYLAAAQISDDPKVARRAVELATRVGKALQAQIAATRWLQLAPNSVAALQASLQLSLELEQTDAAADAMTRLVQLDPDQRANAWRAIHRWVEPYRHTAAARHAVSMAMQRTMGQTKPDILLLRSNLAHFLGADERALIEASRASDAVREGNVKDAKLARQILRWTALLAVDGGDNPRAIEVLRLALSADPEDIPVRLQLAERIMVGGDYAGALKVLDAAPESSIQIFLARAVYGFRQHDEEGLRQSYEALRANTTAEVARRNLYLGNVAELMGDPALALEWYGKVDVPDLKDKAGLRRAALMLEAGELDAAREQAQQLKDSADDSVATEAYTLLSSIQTRSGHADEALDILTRALAVLPDHPRLLYQRALLAESLDLVYMTEADLRRILDRDPENANALNALGYTLAEHTDRLDEAAELVAHALQLVPDDASFIDSMGWVLYQRGRYDEAVAYLRRAMKKLQNEEIASHLVMALDKSGKRREARELLAASMKQFPDSKALRRAGKGIKP